VQADDPVVVLSITGIGLFPFVPADVVADVEVECDVLAVVEQRVGFSIDGTLFVWLWNAT